MLLKLLNKNSLIIGLLSGLIIFRAAATMAETLEDAWNVAIDNNHLIKSAKADTSASEQQLYSAQGQRLPELNVGTGYILSLVKRRRPRQVLAVRAVNLTRLKPGV